LLSQLRLSLKGTVYVIIVQGVGISVVLDVMYLIDIDSMARKKMIILIVGVVLVFALTIFAGFNA
jgi:hypothetical protein